MSTLTLERIAARLAEHRAADLDQPGARRAAVAALLRFDRGRPEVLLMKRIERDGDRWSGHVSLPGGNQQPDDADLVATAVRETREEVAIDLEASARLLGRLDAIRPMSRAGPVAMSVTPFVFELTGEVDPSPGDEAESVFWLPLDLAAGGNLDSHYEYLIGATAMALPCWRFDGYVVWGLTYRLLRDLFDLVTGAG
jgi:8-oxo-dGTP pyrophosphatase MutT (NUDIX family)